MSCSDVPGERPSDTGGTCEYMHLHVGDLALIHSPRSNTLTSSSSKWIAAHSRNFLKRRCCHSLTRVLHAILCCRVILHLRQAAELGGVNSESSGTVSSSRLSTVRFKLRERLRRNTAFDDSMEMTVRESTIVSV